MENTHTHPFNGPFSGTTQTSQYQKGKTNLDFTEARDSEWKWHQLGHMQVCTSLQTNNHATIPPLKFFTGWMPFLPPNQQHQSTGGTTNGKKQLKCESEFKQVSNVTNQILKDDGERVIGVNNVMKRHDVGMFQIPQQ